MHQLMPVSYSASSSQLTKPQPRILVVRHIKTCPDRLTDASHGHNIALVDTFTAAHFPTPGRLAIYKLRPEWIGPALYRAHSIDSTLAFSIQENTCTGVVCGYQASIVKSPQVMISEPFPGKPQMPADCLRLESRKIDMITRPACAAPATPRT